MATIALAVVGVALAPFTGGAGLLLSGITGISGAGAGLMLGSMIDSMYTFPAIFGKGQGSVEGPKIDDLQVQTGSEGSPLKYTLGIANRVAGTVIWISPLIEEKSKESSQGGKGGGGGSSQVSYNYFVHVQIAVCEGVITNIDKIWADSKIIWDDTLGPGHKSDGRATDIRIALGDRTQVADSLVESYEGAGNVPAYRDTVVVTIERLALKDFGNRLPQFTFQIRTQDPHESVRAAISNILQQKGGLTFPTDYDVELVDGSLWGYSLAGPVNAIQAIEPILLAYDIECRESNGKLFFFQRGLEDHVTVNGDDVAAVEFNNNTKRDDLRPFQITDPDDADLPREVNVTYLDPSLDFQNGSQRAIRIDAPGRSIQTISIPMVLATKQARNIAAIQLWRQYRERQLVEITLPPSYMIVEETDILEVLYAGDLYLIRCTEVNVGDNFLVQIKGVLTDTLDVDMDAECARRLSGAAEVFASVPLTAVFQDAAALRESDTVQPGIYFAAALPAYVEGFGGGALFTSNDNVTFQQVASIDQEATIGVALTALTDGDVGIPDEVNTVDVIVSEGELISVTDDQLLNGANRAWLGTELLGFRTATLTAPSTYTLAGLLRGLRASPATGHGSGDRFLLIDANSVQFFPVNSSSLNSTRYFKVVGAGQDLADVPTYISDMSGESVKQFPVCHIEGLWDSFDLTVTWIRRSRALSKMFGPKPLLAELEEYTVELYNGTTLLRTFTTTSPTFVYTASEQIADGRSPGDLVTVTIYQMGVHGAGQPASKDFNHV